MIRFFQTITKAAGTATDKIRNFFSRPISIEPDPAPINPPIYSNVSYETHYPATPQQVFTIWGMTKRHGNHPIPHSILQQMWKETASESIALAKAGKWDQFETIIQAFDPDWKLTNYEHMPEPETIPEPEQKPEQKTEPKEDDPIQKALKELQKAVEEKAKPKEMIIPPLNPKTAGYVKPKQFDFISLLLLSHMQPCLVGPAGLGKSRMLKEIAKSNDLEFFPFSFAGLIRESRIIGRMELKDGNSFFQPSELVKAMQRDRIVISFEEIPTAEPSMAILLNAALEKSERVIYTPDGTITVNPTCYFAASGNSAGRETSGMYVAAQPQDASILNRFTVINLDYEENVESALIEPIAKDKSPELLKRIKDFRKKLRTHSIDVDPSTRQLIKCAEMVSIGINVDTAWDTVFLGPLTTAERQKVQS